MLWLSPFHPSPNRDDGYDIVDYYDVDPRYGTLGDFVEFMHEANGRGIRVVIDLVVNHTSDRHPWFREALQGPGLAASTTGTSGRRSDRRIGGQGWYFPACRRRPGATIRQVGKYYFHRFYDFEPDLNMDNPQVRDEIRRIMGFWLELGVAGFRVDAVPFVIEKPSRRRSETARVRLPAGDARVPPVARG